MSSPLLIPTATIFDGAEPIDCVRQSLIALTTARLAPDVIVSYVDGLHPFLTPDADELLFSDLLLVIRQCFECEDPKILDALPWFLANGLQSRVNLLAAIVALNGIKKAVPDFVPSESVSGFLDAVADGLSPQFHSFKPHKSYTLGTIELSAKEAISVMLCTLKILPIKSETLLTAALFLWHFEANPASSIDFSDLLAGVDASLFQGVFASRPRKSFLFLCSDPTTPNTICPAIADKLVDFSDVPFFLKALPIPQLHLFDEVITDCLQNLADTRILSPRLRHPLLRTLPVWHNIVTHLDEGSLANVAECFLGNITDVSETLAELILSLPAITKVACLFFIEIFNKNSELRLHFSYSQMLVFVLQSIREPPPHEFWQLIHIELPFEQAFAGGQRTPVAFLGFVYYLIASNRTTTNQRISRLEIPEIDESTQKALFDYLKNVEPTLDSLFDTVPNDPKAISIIGAAMFTGLGFRGSNGEPQVVGLDETNTLIFLTLQLKFFRTVVLANELLDVVLTAGKLQIDQLDGIVRRLKDPLSALDELSISTVFEVLIQYSPFLENPIAAANLLLLASACYKAGLVRFSNTINKRFCEAITVLGKLFAVQRSRVTTQIVGVFRHLGDDFLAFLVDRVDYFEEHPINLAMLFESREAAVAACSKFLKPDCRTIRFFERGLSEIPQCKIQSPDAFVALYRETVAREDWEDAGLIAGFLSTCGSPVNPTLNEIVSIVVNAKVDFSSEVPNYLLELIQQHLSDDNTQRNAIVNYVTNLPVFPQFDLRAAWNIFRRYFRAKKEVIIQALAAVLAPSSDKSLLFFTRATPLPIDPPPDSAYELVESFVNALIAQPSPKLFIFVRAIFVSYHFLFAKLSDEKKLQLINVCFDALDKYQEYLDTKGKGRHQREKFAEIHSAVLLLSILLTGPSFADLFFATTLERLHEFSPSKVSYVLKLFLVFFAKSQLLAAIAASYLLRSDGLAKISEAFLKSYDGEKQLPKETLVVYNTLMQYLIDFVSQLSDVDVINLDELSKSEKPFTEFQTTGALRSSLTLVPLEAFETFNTDEESECGRFMATALLSPPESEEEETPSSFQKSLLEALKPTPSELYSADLPRSINAEKFFALDLAQQSLLLRKSLPKTPRITPVMTRVLLKQPAWVQFFVLQDLPQLLLPEHYCKITKVLEELNQVHDDTDIPALKAQFVTQVLCNEGYLRAILTVLNTASLSKQIVTRCLDNFYQIVRFKPALEKSLELLDPIVHAGKSEDLTLVHMILAASVRSRVVTTKLRNLLDTIFLATFLQPKWRNDAQNMELVTDLVTSFYRQNPQLPLPRRIVHLVSFLYMSKLYRIANAVSHLLNAAQKESLRPIVEPIYESLRNSSEDENQVDLMNLVRAYPFLSTDRPKLLRDLNLLLASYTPAKIDLIAATVNVLMSEELYASEPDASVALGSSPAPLSMPISVYNKFPEFWQIVARHRTALTEIVRTTRFRAFISSPLNFIFRFPIVEDLPLKLSYFRYSQRMKLEDAPEVKLEFTQDGLIEQSIQKMIVDKQPEDWRVKFTPTLLEATKDWFTAVAAELFIKGPFIRTPNLRCFTIKPEGTSEVDLLALKFAGFFIGLSLLQEKKVNIRLAPWIFKQLLDTPVTLRDMELVDVVVARSYRRLLKEPAGQLGLFFTVGVERDGRPTEVELIPNGARTPVTDRNKVEYVREMLKFHFHHIAEQQVQAFRAGFFAVIEQKEIQMFTADELEMLICGQPKMDVEDLRKNCIISAPYSLEHPVIKAFFAMLQKWDEGQLGKLLWFITGSSELPIGGFEVLKKNGCPIQIEPITDALALPTAHTCFSILDLPPYASVELMEAMFVKALEACHQ
jgi:hypothetical protein